MKSAACLAMALMLVAGPAKGEPTLTLSSSAGPGPVTLGQTIRIDVNISGINGGQLELLAAGAALDDERFSAPSQIQAGSIVPNAALSFFGEGSPGFADGIFESIDDGAANRISDNGRFFSFEVTALTAGVGEVSLDIGDALRFNANDPFAPIEADIELGPSLFITVVPEPTGAAAGGVAIGLVALRRRRRRRC